MKFDLRDPYMLTGVLIVLLLLLIWWYATSTVKEEVKEEKVEKEESQSQPVVNYSQYELLNNNWIYLIDLGTNQTCRVWS